MSDNETLPSAQPNTYMYYYNNPMTLLADCLSGDPARQLGCVTSTIVGAYSTFVFFPIICIGFFSNCLVEWVTLFRMRPLTRQNVFFGSIAAVDSITMPVFGLLGGFLNRGLPWISGGRVSYFIMNAGEAGCKAYFFIIGVGHLMPVALILVMVGDRALSLIFPFRFRFLGPGAAAKTILTAALASAVLALPPMILATQMRFSDPGGNTVISCYFANLDYIMPYMNLFCYPPTAVLVAILLLNLVLMVCVVRAIRQRKRKLAEGVSGARDGQQLSGAITILVMSLVTLLLNMPGLALQWMMDLLNPPGSANRASTAAQILMNLMLIFKSLPLVAQTTNLPVMLFRDRKFRASLTGMLPQAGSRGSDIGSAVELPQIFELRSING